MNDNQIAAIQRILTNINPYASGMPEDLMQAIGFRKRRKKMIVVFAKLAGTATTAIKDVRGHLECAAEDLLIRRDTGNDLFDQWSVEQGIFDKTYTMLGGYQAKTAQEANWMEAGWLPCYKSSWQWMMQVSVDFHPVAVPTIEKAVEPLKLNDGDWLTVGVKGEMWPIEYSSGFQLYEDV